MATEKNYQFYFDKENSVKQIYEMIVQGNHTEELFIALAQNFVSPEEVLVRSLDKSDEMKAGPNTFFDKNTGNYKSTTWGFVHYEGLLAVEVMPVVYLNEERSCGLVILPPQENTKNTMYFDDVNEAIEAFDVKLPVNVEGVQNLVQDSLNSNVGGAVVFAEGKAPVHGKVAKVILDYDFSMGVGKKTKGDKIDFKERGFVHNISTGDLIAHYDDPIEPVDGLDVFGGTIKAEMDNDPIYRIGKNVTVNKEENEISAAIDGIISLASATIAVHDVMEIPKNVDYSTGNIEAQGSVVVHGSITPGFSVHAVGDIIVEVNIEEANIECEGNIKVMCGIIGSENTKVRANGHIRAGFIRNAQVECMGNVVAEQSIMNSNVQCDGKAICIEGKGVVIGGTISAARGIYAKSVGTPSGTPTELIIGKSLEVDRRIREIAGKMNENKEQLKKLKATLGADYFRDPKKYLSQLHPKKVPLIKQVLLQMSLLAKENNKLEEEKEQIQNRSVGASKATVTVYETINESCAMYMRHVRREVTKPLSSSEFYYSKEYDAILERGTRELAPEEYQF